MLDGIEHGPVVSNCGMSEEPPSRAAWKWSANCLTVASCWMTILKQEAQASAGRWIAPGVLKIVKVLPGYQASHSSRLTRWLGRHGNKGVYLGPIMPWERHAHDEFGTPVDIVLNPLDADERWSDPRKPTGPRRPRGPGREDQRMDSMHQRKVSDCASSSDGDLQQVGGRQENLDELSVRRSSRPVEEPARWRAHGNSGNSMVPSETGQIKAHAAPWRDLPDTGPMKLIDGRMVNFLSSCDPVGYMSLLS